jgi:hypothetical protein
MPTAINSISSAFSDVRTTTILDEQTLDMGFGYSKNELDENKFTLRVMTDLCKVDVGPLTAGLRGGVQYSFAGQSANVHSRDAYVGPYGYTTDQIVTRTPGATSIELGEIFVQSPTFDLGPMKVRLEASAAGGYGWVDKGAKTYQELWVHHHGDSHLLARDTLASYPGEKDSGFVWTPAIGVKVDTGYGEVGLAYMQTFTDMDDLKSHGVMATFTFHF